MVDSGPNPYEAPAAVGNEEAVPGMAPLLDGRLSLTAWGLKLIYWGVLILLISWIAMLPIGFVVSTTSTSTGNSTSMDYGQMIQWAFVGLTLTGFAFVNLGPFLCLSAPAGHGLRPLAIATVLAILLVWLSVMFGSMVVAQTWIFFSGSSLSLFLAFAFFLAFLHQLTRVIGRDDLRRRCRIVFFLGVAAVLLMLGQTFLARLATAADPLWLILGVAVFISALVLFVGYANLVNAIANAIRHPERGRARGIL